MVTDNGTTVPYTTELPAPLLTLPMLGPSTVNVAGDVGGTKTLLGLFDPRTGGLAGALRAVKADLVPARG